MDFTNTLKSILYAGVGAAAIGLEKGKVVIDELVKKGEITVEQGKQLNEELKAKAAEKKEDIWTEKVKNMTQEGRDQLRKALDDADMFAKETAKDIKSAAGAYAGAIKEAASNLKDKKDETVVDEVDSECSDADCCDAEAKCECGSECTCDSDECECNDDECKCCGEECDCDEECECSDKEDESCGDKCECCSDGEAETEEDDEDDEIEVEFVEIEDK